MVGRVAALEIVWHKRLSGGYGWIFPCPGGTYNIGAGLTGSHQVEVGGGRLKMQDVNLRQMFDAFCEVHAPARELMAGGSLVGEVKGAPLRCSLGGARWSRPGLFTAKPAAPAFTGGGHRQGAGDRAARRRGAGRRPDHHRCRHAGTLRPRCARAEAALQATTRPRSSITGPG